MGKLFGFIACAFIFIIGVGCGYCEIHRLIVYNHAMSDEQWVGEIFFLFIYGAMVVESIGYVIHQWREKY